MGVVLNGVLLGVSFLHLGMILGAVTALPSPTDSPRQARQNVSVEAAVLAPIAPPEALLEVVEINSKIVSMEPGTEATTVKYSLVSTAKGTRRNTHPSTESASRLLTEPMPAILRGLVNTSSLPRFYIDINDCAPDRILLFEGREGVIRGFLNKDTFNGTARECYFNVTVPEGLYLKAFSRIVREPSDVCDGSTAFEANDKFVFNFLVFGVSQWDCFRTKSYGDSPLVLAPGNSLIFYVYDLVGRPNNFWLYFTGVPTDLRGTFSVVHETENRGYITTHGFEENLYFAMGVNATHTIHLPEDHVVMISVKYLSLEESLKCSNSLELFSNDSLRQLWKVCTVMKVDAHVYNTSLVLNFTAKGWDKGKGVKVLFSFHPSSQSPLELDSGLFDCSRNYSTFRHHLDCNWKQECEGGEDEAEHCQYFSPLCPGAVRVQDKCISLETFRGDVKGSWMAARTACQKLGGDLASLVTAEEVERVNYLLNVSLKGPSAYVGLQLGNISTQNMYRKTFRWIDGTIAYGVDFLPSIYRHSLYQSRCLYKHMNFPNGYFMNACHNVVSKSFLCERKVDLAKHVPKASVKFPVLDDNSAILSHARLRLVQCPDDHVTHDFLSCDVSSQCGATRRSSRCVTVTKGVSTIKEQVAKKDVITVEMFPCHALGGNIPYTLLCDFRRDCEDGSDEKYCKHKPYTSGFRCRSGQHIQKNKTCNIISDCLDGSDEVDCANNDFWMISRHFRKPPPVIIHFNSGGNFTEVAMANNTAPCPVTHFRCPGQSVYCMPVFLRCNGVRDCPGGEDEVSCPEFTCPGFYRCRGSSVCLHASYLCDGWPQCPQRDDELLCEDTCPSVCRCQGLAFVCPRPYPADNYPDVRYLDAARSGIAPSALAENFYLIYLSLADCGLDTWSGAIFQNLQHLDLSDNTIPSLHTPTFVSMESLRVLRLKGNPLTGIVTGHSEANHDHDHDRLITMDLSHTRLVEFNSTLLANFPSLETLNLSYSSVNSISKEGFSGLPRLNQIDLTGCDAEDFPSDLFHGLQDVSVIYASNYKLCCKATLPEQFNENFCFAPQDEISSCEDLLRSGIYRVFLWVISFLSVFGNAGCLVLRLVFNRRSITRSSYNIFVTSLSLADFLMGVYLAIVGGADQQYRGSYLWYEKTWKSSGACKVAGFLSLLSSEVSAFMICLITLDRFIVLRFPFSTVRFKGRSAVVASGLAWLGGVLLAAVPLMPSLTHWGFYSQTGICIPLPVTRNSFLGRGYSFGVMIVFNFILFVAIACGQAVIYRSIRANSMVSQDGTNASRDLTVARRLITVVVSDFLCWFPIGVLGLMAFNGVPVPGEVNVAMAIFVLPLNAALNPFLYTFNIVMEKRRRVREDRLRKFLARATTQQSEVQAY